MFSSFPFLFFSLLGVSSASNSAMASIPFPIGGSLERCRVAETSSSQYHRNLRVTAAAKLPETAVGSSNQVSVCTSRRKAVLIATLPTLLLGVVGIPSAEARERRNRRKIPPEDYLTSPAEGLKYFDIEEGKGPVAEKGSTVLVHFDCIYRGVTAVSSRESKLLAGNRIIAQPYAFQVGAPPGKERKREFVDNPNGLFSAQASPKPPPAMYTITQGMKVGGKRTVIVPPEAGYGNRGLYEIPVITHHLPFSLPLLSISICS
ncbi:Peptidyl-prolyl cis-trans isomerase FKBP18, chloroplastic [Linum perenne]